MRPPPNPIPCVGRAPTLTPPFPRAVFLMKWCAGIIVWGIIFLLILGCFGITFYAYLKAGLVPEDLIQTTVSLRALPLVVSAFA